VYPPNHPLNPSLNGLHWGWSGGFVFAALEGRWRSENGALGGYSYHLATDANLAMVELPVALDLSRDLTLKLAFDLSRVFGDVRFSDENATTHSREGDPLAAKLREQLRAAFSIVEVSPTPTRAEAAAKLKALIAPGATPYQFTFPVTFPRPSLPLDNPLTNEGVSLGKRLFTETRLSGNHTQSCSSCHAPEMGFSDVRPQSTGADGDVGSRNSMPLMNLAWKNVFFWDGRAPSLRAQVVQPISNPIEMHTTLDEVVRLLSELPHYPPMFEAAFGTPEINGDRVARALEQYLLTLIASDSKFDRAMRSQETLSAEEKRGFELFHTEYDPQRGQFGADCFHCHGGPLFLSSTFANNGLDEHPSDPGRFAATGNEGDRGKFATPSLRNVANTAPYMHDGRFATLEAVVEHYDHGVKRSATLDPNLAKHPRDGMKLSSEDKRALVAFLKTLTEPDR
jgi:cytochrome c peroxidase